MNNQKPKGIAQKMKALLAAAAILAATLMPTQADEFAEADIAACESEIQQKMETSPATYLRIKLEDIGYNIEDRRLLRVTFDAQNVYGALMRNTETCLVGEPDAASAAAWLSKENAVTKERVVPHQAQSSLADFVTKMLLSEKKK
jgi:hypothetical protein